MEKTFMDDLDRTIFPYVEYPGYPFRYPTHLPLIVKRKQIEEVRRVSGELYRIFAKAVKRAMECDDSFMDDMEIPEKLREYLHGGNAMKDLPTWISRFDYVIDEKTELSTWLKSMQIRPARKSKPTMPMAWRPGISGKKTPMPLK